MSIGWIGVGLAAVLALSASAAAQAGADTVDATGIVEVRTPADAESGLSLIAFAVQAALALVAAWFVWRRRLYRPKPGRLPGAEPAPTIPPGILLIGALMLWLAQAVGRASAIHLLQLEQGHDPTLGEMSLAMVGNYTGFVAGFVVMCVALPHLCKAIGLHLRARELTVGLTGSLLIIPIVVALGTALALLAQWLRGPVELTAHTGLSNFVASDDARMRLLFAGLVVVAAPVTEEIVYRGLIQSACLRAMRSAWAAIVMTSVIFTYMHVTVVEWYALPALFVLSMGLGIAAERTKGLLAPIVIHAAFNLLNLGMALMTAGPPHP